MGAFCRKSGGKPKERMLFPLSLSSRPSSFRAQREIFLAQRSSGERQMRSSRSTHAILSLPHKYRVPLRRERSLGYARDDDTRERAISHGFSSDHVESCPYGAVYPPPSARPFFKGAAQLACKSATPKRHSLPDGKVNEMRIPLSPYQKPSPRGEGAPKGRIGYWRYEREWGMRFKQAENENTAFPVSSFRAKREIFLAHGKTGLWDGKKQKHPGRHENK